MFGNALGQQNQQDNLGPDYGGQLVERIMAAEYNLAMQREPGWVRSSPGGILAQMLGQWLQERGWRFW